MHTIKKKLGILAVVVGVAAAVPAIADCCANCYVSAIQDINNCDSQYPPPADAAWESCVGNAYNTAANCTHQG